MGGAAHHPRPDDRREGQRPGRASCGSARSSKPTGPRSFSRSPTHAYTRKLFAAAPSGQPIPAPAASNVRAGDRQAPGRVPFGVGASCSPARRSCWSPSTTSPLSLKSGETLGIVGESGSGKTTLGKAILKLMHNDGGTIDWKGNRLDTKSKAEMRPFRPQMQVVFQDPFSLLNPRLSVKQIIEEGLIVNQCRRQWRRPATKRVRDTLQDVGLDPNTLNRYPHDFSGGQRQRIAHCARAGAGPGIHPARRADVGARSLRARSGHRPVARSAEAARARLFVHQPRPESRSRALPSRHRHVRRQGRRVPAIPRRSWMLRGRTIPSGWSGPRWRSRRDNCLPTGLDPLAGTKT